MTDAPVSALVAWWGTAWLRGHASADDLLDALAATGLRHVVAAPGDPSSDLVLALADLRRAGATSVGAAFPVAGDLVGLGGPAAFNAAALDGGEAVVAAEAGVGWTPVQVGAAIEWTVHPAQRRQLPDVGEADRTLRATLITSAQRLADLDVARWQPDVADALMDLRRPPVPDVPPGVPARCVDLATRALQAIGIAELAVATDGGAVTAAEIDARRAALLPLDRAGRHALTAACSPEVWPPG